MSKYKTLVVYLNIKQTQILEIMKRENHIIKRVNESVNNKFHLSILQWSDTPGTSEVALIHTASNDIITVRFYQTEEDIEEIKDKVIWQCL